MTIRHARGQSFMKRNLKIYYYLLAQGFAYPSAELAEKINNGAFGGMLKAAGARLGIRNGRELPAVSPCSLETLEIEYTRLFINAPGHLPAPPYASCYLSWAERGGRGIAEAINYYRSAGVAISRNFTERADHIIAELEFILYLISEGELAPEKSEVLARIRSHFLRSHFSVWVPAFIARVEENDRSGFYRSLAGATKYIVDWETTRWREKVAGKEGGGR